MNAPDLSVVVPVYGCASCVEALHDRVRRTLEQAEVDWELILVDDSSPDGSWTRLEQIAHEDPRVRALRMSRNFGQHAAITAGLSEARGERVVVMDCDLQDAPEDIPRLLDRAREGFDVVLARRDQRRQSLPRRVTARAYFKLRNVLLGAKVDTEYATLSVISRTVVDAFLSMGDRDRQYMLILHWLGFRRGVVQIAQSERAVGRSSYTFSKLLKVAVDGMFFQTTRLLRWIVYGGFVLGLLGVLLAITFMVMYFVNRPLPGFTSLAVLILLVGGFIMFSTGVMGLYVGKIFEQVKGRPLYVIAERTDVAEPALPPVRTTERTVR